MKSILCVVINRPILISPVEPQLKVVDYVSKLRNVMLVDFFGITVFRKVFIAGILKNFPDKSLSNKK